jgi:chromate transporter
MNSIPNKPSFNSALKFWFKLGCISFGGPAGQIAIMHEFLVDQKKWISNAKFIHALNYCMLLPGPEAQQLATYIGWLFHGKKGGFVAGVLFVLPSVFILLLLSIVYVVYGQLPWVSAIFYGLKPAVVAIVVLALIKISGKSLSTTFSYFIAALSFVCIYFFNVSFPLIILGAIVIAFICKQFFPKLLASNKSETLKKEDESDYYLNTNSVIPHATFNLSKTIRLLLIGVALWIAPLLLFYFLSGDYAFWNTLVVFFTKAAFVTFGGAYAVLPYVAQVSVEKMHWLTNLQMIDGLALGETTPGPLVMVLAFVGFMGSYGHFNGSLLLGGVGLFTTTYFTFLPSFLFIFIGAPIIEKTQNNSAVKSILKIITAAVVGVVLNLTVYFGKAVLFPKEISIASIDYFSLVLIIISFFALYKLKINMLYWIGISAFIGLVHYFIFF